MLFRFVYRTVDISELCSSLDNADMYQVHKCEWHCNKISLIDSIQFEEVKTTRYYINRVPFILIKAENKLFGLDPEQCCQTNIRNDVKFSVKAGRRKKSTVHIGCMFLNLIHPHTKKENFILFYSIYIILSSLFKENLYIIRHSNFRG